MKLTAYVTITVPVGLEFDAAASLEEIRAAAIENACNHPALIGDHIEIGGYVDKITLESEAAIVRKRK